MGLSTPLTLDLTVSSVFLEFLLHYLWLSKPIHFARASSDSIFTMKTSKNPQEDVPFLPPLHLLSVVTLNVARGTHCPAMII